MKFRERYDTLVEQGKQKRKKKSEPGSSRSQSPGDETGDEGTKTGVGKHR